MHFIYEIASGAGASSRNKKKYEIASRICQRVQFFMFVCMFVPIYRCVWPVVVCMYVYVP